MKPTSMTAVIGKKRYSTDTAALIAHNAYWDGNNWERQGRNTFLFKTPRGSYFAQHLTRWEGEHDRLEPVTQDEAIELYEGSLRSHELEFDQAFPGVKVVEA